MNPTLYYNNLYFKIYSMDDSVSESAAININFNTNMYGKLNETFNFKKYWGCRSVYRIY